MGTSNKVAAYYADPLTIQNEILSGASAQVAGGRIIPDPNSVASFLIDSFASISADQMRAVIDDLEGLYPKRAQTADQLYRHMSDFDYAGLFATPAVLKIELLFDKSTLIRESLSFNDNYKKIIIPKESQFTIDGIDFSLNYPVEIKINKQTETFIVSYDTSTHNRLESLTNNTIEHRMINSNGLDLISIMLPIHQFTRVTKEETVAKGEAFVKSYDFSDKFYAASVFTNTGENGAWVEMATTLSEMIYDPKRLTAQLVVDNSRNTVKIAIPQTYFTSGLVGSKIRADIYTTKGAMNADFSSITDEGIIIGIRTIDDPAVDPYVTILTRPNTIAVNILQTKLTGGGDGLNFEDLRNRVIYNSYVGDLLVTPVQMENFFRDQGFKVVKYRDGITDRIYMCSKRVVDKKSSLVATANVSTFFTIEALGTDSFPGLAATSTELAADWTTTPEGIKLPRPYHAVINDDNSYTIYPSIIYKYNTTNGTCIPLTRAEMIALRSLNNEAMVEAHNSNKYTMSPYHWRIDTTGKTPVSYAYDFTDPTIDGITFIKENTSISSQLTIYDASLTHKVNPNIISMALQMHKSTDINKKFTELNIPDIDYSNYFKVVGVFETETGSLIFQEITPVGGVYANKTTTIDLYRVDFETNFKLTRGNQIEITSLTDAYGLKGFNVGLKTKMRVITLLHNSIAGVGSSTNVGIDVAYLYPGFTPMTEQEVGITFGRRVDEVFARTDIFYSQAKYQTYVEDVKRIRTKNEYARDIDGNLIYPLEIVYSAGDIDYGGLRFTRTITSDNAYLFIGYKHITGPSSFTVLTATLLTALIGSTILMEEPATTVTVTFTGTNNLDYLDYKVASSGDLIVASGSDAGTVAASTLSGEIELISPRFVHRKGDIVVDGYRNRLIDKERGVNYSLDMIHLDRKLLLSQKVEHEDYLNQYTSLLRSYFEAVSSAKGRLIEETAVYFQPQRSLGVAKFRKNADAAINLDLELSVDLKLYVFQHVMDDSRLKQLIRDAIITIINDALSKGSISVTTIAEIIRTSIPHLVKFVDVKGVNGNIGLQTLIPMDPDVVPGLKQELVISDDGSISMQHALHLEFDPIGVS